MKPFGDALALTGFPSPTALSGVDGSERLLILKCKWDVG